MAKHEIFREALLCLRCGSCHLECPIFQLTAGYYGSTHFGDIGAIRTVFTQGIEEAAPIAYTCLLCGRCKVQCLLEIDIPQMILEIRRYFVSRKFISGYVKELIDRTIHRETPYAFEEW